MSKATKAVVDRRVAELLRIILDGAQGWDICEYVRENEQEKGSVWEVPEGGKPLSDSQIRRYAARASQLIAESTRAHRKKLLRRHLAKRRNLYAKAVNQGDIRAALACLDSEAKITGLFEDELTRQIEELERQLQEIRNAFREGQTPAEKPVR